MKTKTIIDTLLALLAFAVMVALALCVAVCVSPDCLGAAYHFQADALQENLMVKTPAFKLEKERVYLELIEAATHNDQRKLSRLSAESAK